MKTKKQIRAAALEAEAWEERRNWEAAWRESVRGQKFLVEEVMLPRSNISGKTSVILKTNRVSE